jgi:hypothetical protein
VAAQVATPEDGLSFLNLTIDFLSVKCYYYPMWEATSAFSHGRVSVRRVINYVFATIVASFLWSALVTQMAHAAPDATWNGATISYQTNAYIGPTDATTVGKLSLIKDTTAYTYVDPVPSGTGTSTSGTLRLIHVIYFAPGVDSSTATGAEYKTYIYQGPSSFSGPTNPISISITPQTASTSTSTSSCNVDGGLGYIICPVTKTLATGMDWIFNVLSGFLAVRPAETGQDTVLFRAWSFMRSFANVAFVIAFLIIIYSQLTNVGLNNYNIKKMLPRLVIAAILVNLSYYISSIAIDISNVLGYSIQDVFIQIRNSLVGSSGNSWDLMNFQSISSFILSGGTAAVAGGVALFSTLSTYGVAGSLFLLLPALLAGLMAVIVALVVMAARQALITLLVIISPLAFVAYLLPNTEKWFDKWRSTFMTLLVLFPAFSLIFGGSQLAATAIIQNADSINVVILGMIVQVAPLFITPMLIKLSGGTVARIAGIINNPNKGIIDRTKNWSKDRADNVKAKRLGETAKKGQLLRRAGQRADHNRRKREGQRKLHESMADNRFLGSLDNAKLYETQHEVETAKKTIEERLSSDLSAKIRLTPELLKKEMRLHVITDESALQKARLDQIHDELRAGKVTDHGAALNSLAQRSELATRDLALTSIATEQAKRKQQSNLSEALMKNTSRVNGDKLVREYAAGIETITGQDSALSFAVNQQYEAEAKLVGERSRLIKQFKLNGDERQELAMGKNNVTATATINGISANYEFKTNDDFARDAAIDLQLTTGSLNQIMELMTHSGTGSSLEGFMKTISEGIPKNQLPAKAAWMSGVFIDRVLRGTITNKQTQREAIINYYIKPGKFKPEQLSTNDADAITEMTRAIKIADRADPVVSNKLTALSTTIDGILDKKSEVYNNTSEASRTAFRELQHMIAHPTDPSPREKYPD